MARGIAMVLDHQRGALFPWVPVFFGAGIAGYFALRAEPGPVFWGSLGLVVVIATGLARRAPRLAPLLMALVCFGLGAGNAALRTWSVAEPVLQFRYYGPIEGRIRVIDRSGSDKVRLTLDNVALERVPAERTPARIRISLHGQQGFFDPRPGQVVIATGHLGPPEGPVEPHGFDFQRQAWFKKLGAVGYTRTPVLLLEDPDPANWSLVIHKLRMAISRGIQAELPGPTGAFAAAVTAGDRSGMDIATVEALRRSNLAHLLAISGLHMGLLTGFLFVTVRYGIALVPPAALRLPAHKIGAVVALGAGAFYLALSGGSVSTERAFIMVAVMLAAVLFDRRALTLRAVSLAALIVLLLRPEALLGPGFQMSFAATLALIGVFERLRETGLWAANPVARWAFGLLVSSLVAGLATAPFAAAHFNRVPHYGLIANLLSVPVMGIVVMPAAVIAALLWPVGLHWIGLAAMDLGIGWILQVATQVSGIAGAVSHIVSPSPLVLPVLSAGALFVLFWRGRWRVAGALPVVAALALWAMTERPDVLVTTDAGLVGVMTDAGRALSKERGNGFAARSWLENDGDAASQADASARESPTGKGTAGGYQSNGLSVVHVRGRNAARDAALACGKADLVIAAVDALEQAGECRIFDRASLQETGPVAVYTSSVPMRVVSAREVSGIRPWNAPRKGKDQ